MNETINWNSHFNREDIISIIRQYVLANLLLDLSVVSAGLGLDEFSACGRFPFSDIKQRSVMFRTWMEE